MTITFLPTDPFDQAADIEETPFHPDKADPETEQDIRPPVPQAVAVADESILSDTGSDLWDADNAPEASGPEAGLRLGDADEADGAGWTGADGGRGFDDGLRTSAFTAQSLPDGSTDFQSTSITTFATADAVQMPTGTISAETLEAWRDGLLSSLGAVENAIAQAVLAQALPLFDDRLRAAFDAGVPALRGVSSYTQRIADELADLIATSAAQTEQAVEGAVNGALQQSVFDGLTFSITGTEFSLVGGATFTPYAQTLAGDFGLGNLISATSTGTAQLTVDYGVNLTAGVDGSGFYLRTDANGSELSLNFDATIPDAGAGLVLGDMLRFSATDLGSTMDADFALDLRDADGKLRLSEMNTAGFLDARASGGLDLSVRLQSDMGTPQLPSFTTDLGVEWNFAADGSGAFGSTPKITFENTELDFGSFIENVLKPFVANVAPMLDPLKEVLGILTADIGFMHNLPGASVLYDKVDDLGLAGMDGKITLLDLAHVAAPANPELQAATVFINTLKTLVDVTDFLSGNLFPTVGAYSLGSFEITSDIRDATFELASAARTVTQAGENLQNFIDANYAGVNATTLRNLLTKDPTDPDDNPALVTAPILTDAMTALGYLFGQRTDLLNIDLPEFGVSFGGAFGDDGRLLGPLTDLINIPIPVVPGLSIEVEGALFAAIDMGFGYDTRGLEYYVSGGYADPLELLNGFYLSDFDANGVDRPEIKIGAQINFGLGFGVDMLAKAFGGGAIEGLVLLDLVDGGDGAVSDGKVYYDEFTGLLSNPLDLFQGQASITASLIAYATLFGATVWEQRSPAVLLGSLDFGGGSQPFDPNLASLLDDGSLVLHVGDDAGLRNVPTRVDGNETVSVVKSGTSLRVLAFGQEDRFQNVTTIYGIGQNGNDVLSVAQDVLIAADLRGGLGDDQLFGGGGADTLSGGANADGLFGGAGDDTLFGDAQDDLLVGGAGADHLDGGTGVDVASYSSSAAVVTVSLSGGTGSGGDAAGDTLVNVEHLVGTDIAGTGDSLTGSAAGNILNGLSGDDLLRGLGGSDTLIGGAGKDTLNGGTGTDLLSGGEGDDVYMVDRVGDDGDIVDEDAFGPGGGRDRIVASVNISIAGLTDIEELELTGTARIGEGNLLANLMIGTASGDELRGLEGADTLDGLGGADTLIGGAGADLMRGGEGSDLYLVDDADDAVAEVASQGTDTISVAVDYLLASGVAVEVLAARDPAAVTGLSLRGNELAQTLIGDAGNNVLEGGAGADTLDGRAGADVASYEHAAAAIRLDFAAGQFTGDAAGDVFVGIEVYRGTNLSGQGDTMIGAAGGDWLEGLAGGDWLEGLGGNDTLFGGFGGDRLDGGTGSDLMAGGAGDDLYIVDSLTDVVHDALAGYLTGTGGRDTIEATIDYDLGASSLRGDIENLVLKGGARIGSGNALGNRITGTGGADTLDGRAGADTLVGAGGKDLYIFDSFGDRVVELAGGGIDTIRLQTALMGPVNGVTQTFDLSASWADWVENAALADDDQSVDLTGNALGNVLTGNARSQTLRGGDGNDRLDPGSALLYGRDVVEGGAGADTLVLAWADHHMDLRFFGPGYEPWAIGSLTAGYAGRFFGADERYYNRVDFSGIEAFDIASGDGNDQIVTGDGDDSVISGKGNDHLITYAGRDTIDGGEGQDRWEADKSLATGAQTFDLDLTRSGVQLTYMGAATVRGIEALTLKTGDAADSIVTLHDATNGSTYGWDDRLETGAGADRVKVAGGRDIVDLGAGTDVLEVDWSKIALDMRFFGPGYDAALVGSLATGYAGRFFGADERYYNRVDFAGVETFVVTGGDGNDQIVTGDGDDTMMAGRGTDLIRTGQGVDIVDGGEGIDHWVSDKSFTTSNLTLDLTAAGDQMSYLGTGRLRNVEVVSITTGGGRDRVVTLSNASDTTYHGWNDTILTGAGNDTALVAGGRDVVDMGANSDRLIVDWAHVDRAVRFYGPGYEAGLVGSASAGYAGRFFGDDERYYNRVDFAGVETFDMRTGRGSDRVVTGDHADTITSGEGDDTIQSGRGADVVDGGTGNDRWEADRSDATAQQKIDVDLTAAGVQSTHLGTATVRGIEMLTLRTGAAADVIVTLRNAADTDRHGFHDSLDTGAGNDTVTVAGGHDVVVMGAGTDLLVVDWSGIDRPVGYYGPGYETGAIVAATGGGYAGRFFGDDERYYNRVDFDGVERFDLRSGGGNDFLLTGDFEDTVSGGAGHDHLKTGRGADVVDGGSGNDRWEADRSNATATEKIDVDLTATGVQSTHFGTGTVRGVEMLTLRTGAAADTIVTLRNPADADRHGFHDHLETGAGDDRVTLAGGHDVVIMGAGTDTLIVDWSGIDRAIRYYGPAYETGALVAAVGGGYAGRFFGDDERYYNRVDFDGVERFDLRGGGGDDFLLTGNFDDTAMGGTGNDHIRTGGGDDSLDGGNGSDWLYGEAGADTLFGGAGGDRLYGGENDDVGSGGFGNDKLFGEAGADLLLGEGNEDTIDGGTGADTVEGGEGNDVVRGGAGFGWDVVSGGAGNDRLIGGGGKDTMAGGAGNDKINGGGGEDLFIFVDGFGRDILVNFDADNAEKIDLAGVTEIVGFDDLLANHLVNEGGTAVIVDGMNRIELRGVAFAQVGHGLAYSADDFLF